ncbi:SEFIR domain-containing protein [Bacillus thuringiensis]|uniref:SEFIR domain-containing protein n=1 Tax=Bacillus thuringiensis TaxID=1428 RepID=UPI0011AA4D76|nr:SEFIR domain-containing protein [Bacillus thuringiensis]
MKNEEKVPHVFISYSWSSAAHKQWVLDLANKLMKESGVEVILDRWYGVVGHDRFKFMEDSIKIADKVLVICDKDYCEKANDRRGGVGTETIIITPNVYNDTKQEKFIPISLGEENGEYFLPDFFKSRFALGWNYEDTDESYKELERLIWEEPLLTPPVRGKKPNFDKVEVVESIKSDKPIFDTRNEERVVWLLPRGFLIFSDITYKNYDSWAVVANYYKYDGEWQHGTHYHEAYSRSWDRDLEIQFRKLSIPKADWLWSVAPLKFLMDLREVNEKVDIKKMVESEQKSDYPVFYFEPSKSIELPEVPVEYEFYYKTGKLRDIINSIEDKERNLRLSSEELMEKTISVKHSLYLECLTYLGEQHPSINFIKEVLDEYKGTISKEEILQWFNKVVAALRPALNYEREVWRKQLNPKN